MANSKVFFFFSAKGRASLDHGLRKAVNTRDAVVGIIEFLDQQLMSCKSNTRSS